MARYKVDSACPEVKKLGWTEQKLMNANDMFDLLQAQYENYPSEASVEACVAFYTTSTDNDLDAYMYYTDSVTSAFAQDVSSVVYVYDAIESHLKKVGIELPSIDTLYCSDLDPAKESMYRSNSDVANFNKDLKMCFWHNHYDGAGFSAADMNALAFFHPFVVEAFLDVNSVHLMRPSQELGELLADDSFRYNFRTYLKDVHYDMFADVEFCDARRQLDYEYGEDLATYFDEMERVQGTECSTDFNRLEARALEYTNRFKELKESHRTKYAETNPYFKITKLTKIKQK